MWLLPGVHYIHAASRYALVEYIDTNWTPKLFLCRTHALESINKSMFEFKLTAYAGFKLHYNIIHTNFKAAHDDKSIL